jgi:DNA mismatch repair protein MutL
VELKDGGFSLIRITDNGCGIGEDDIRSAFLRHATSKISRIEDLQTIGSLGFRGEALASIAAVSQTELVTKTTGALMGTRYVIEGGREQAMEAVGCPEGTTFLVRNLFYNTPARKKFMKTPQTEAGYTGDMIQYLAMSHPQISFKFIHNGQIKLQTSGNGNRKEVIYSIFGRDIAANLCEVDEKQETVDGILHLTGFCGKPVISRGNRNLEMYFINGRYIKNAVVNQAVEAAYKPYMMTRKYPFTALYLEMPQELVDVNVHPSKMEAQFGNREMIYQMVEKAVSEALRHKELIPEVLAGREAGSGREKRKDLKNVILGKESSLGRSAAAKKDGVLEKETASEKNIVTGTGLENARSEQIREAGGAKRKERPAEPFEQKRLGEERQLARKQLAVLEKTLHPEQYQKGMEGQENNFVKEASEEQYHVKSTEKSKEVNHETQPRQTELFDMPLLSEEAKKQHRIIGQVFSTYWLVEFADKLFIIDQHAAHEKVLYERNVKAFHEKKEVYAQMIAPPAVVSLSQTEQEILKENLPLLEQLGFEIEPFGGNEYALRAVPADMMNLADEEMFLEILDSLTKGQKTPEFVLEKLASISCKAAVKGGNQLKQQEIEELIDELLTLENPYHCPHGRPTIVSMSKYEMEKKFKRIV